MRGRTAPQTRSCACTCPSLEWKAPRRVAIWRHAAAPLDIATRFVGSRLRVADRTYECVEGRCFAFDDSFEHEAWHDGDRTRIVLVFDVWHPDLHDREVQFLSLLQRSLFEQPRHLPPPDTSTTLPAPSPPPLASQRFSKGCAADAARAACTPYATSAEPHGLCLSETPRTKLAHTPCTQPPSTDLSSAPPPDAHKAHTTGSPLGCTSVQALHRK